MGALGGERAASVLLPYMTSDAKWRRKAATFALGEGAPLTPAVVEALCLRIAEDESVYVRAVAAVALGCLYRRSVASTDHQDGKAQLQVRTRAQPLLATLEMLNLLSAVYSFASSLDPESLPGFTKGWRSTFITNLRVVPRRR